MIGLLAFAAVAAAPVHVECSLPDANGNAVRWQIALNEAEGFADIVIGDEQPMRAKAVFLPETVRFYVGTPGPIPEDVRDIAESLPKMRMDLSRVSLRIARYSGGEDQPPNYGQCKIVRSKLTAF